MYIKNLMTKVCLIFRNKIIFENGCETTGHRRSIRRDKTNTTRFSSITFKNETKGFSL